MNRRPSGGAQALGRGILATAPWLMKALSLAGTAAMFLVGGGILTHGVPALHHWIEQVTAGMGSAGTLLSSLFDAVVGIIAGGILVVVYTLVKKLRRKA